MTMTIKMVSRQQDLIIRFKTLQTTESTRIIMNNVSTVTSSNMSLMPRNLQNILIEDFRQAVGKNAVKIVGKTPSDEVEIFEPFS